jgi:L-phenylalanine/L-methionine N-acetyltransferase
MTILIRAAEPGDYEAVRDVMSQPIAQAQTLQLPFASAEMWRKRLDEFPADGKLLVASIDGRVVGNLGLRAGGPSPRRRHAYSLGMSVHDQFHRRGVGSALMTAAVDLADNWMQATRLELTVFTDNAAAIALYRRFGFEIEGTHKQYAFRNGAYADVYAMARLKAG